MDQDFDVTILGTGIIECVISGMLSVDKKKVFQIDRNDYYGGECASLTPLPELFKYCKASPEAANKYGADREWNVDLIPKVMMANGLLANIFRSTGAYRYLTFHSIGGSYVYDRGGLWKVPATNKECLSEIKQFKLSKALDLNRLRQFHGYISGVKLTDSLLTKRPIQEVYTKYKLSNETQTMVTHALALCPDDRKFMSVTDIAKRINVYADSIGDNSSPFYFPMYGLSSISQAFARLSAVYGGTFMLDVPEVSVAVENGRAIGVRIKDGEFVPSPIVICDPSYVPEMCKVVGKIVRCICLLDHPIRVISAAKSAQIIIPGSRVHRNNDIYGLVLSEQAMVTPSGYFLAIASTTVETNNPESELDPILDLFGSKLQKFTFITEIYEPDLKLVPENLYITMNNDPLTHFGETSEYILGLYQRIMKEDYDIEKHRLETEQFEKDMGYYE